MKIKTRNTLLVGGTVLWVFLMIHPFFSGNVQKAKIEIERMQQDPALEVIKSNGLTRRFYENLQQGEINNGNKWFSSEAHTTPRSDLTGGANLFVINLNDGKNGAQIIISEFKDNSRSGFGQISAGFIKNCKGGLCGDEGQKVYGGNGVSNNFGFRKHNFYVTIVCDSEKTAMRFADYLLKAIAEQ